MNVARPIRNGSIFIRSKTHLQQIGNFDGHSSAH
jgi:hypothetical protein